MRTKDQELLLRVKKFAEEYYLDNKTVPSVRTIATELGITKSTAHNYLKELEECGTFQYDNGSLMTDLIQKYNKEYVKAAIVGSIPCGPAETEEEYVEEYIDLPKAIFGEGPFYILCADGDSMIDAGIDDGDLVVIRVQNTARNGDIVVALVNENENTLKRYYADDENHKVILHPENPEYKDMIFESVVIQGVAVNVIKSLI